MMKTLIAISLGLFLVYTYPAAAHVNNLKQYSDTLKKTTEYALISKSANVQEVFLKRNKKSTDQIVYLKISLSKDDTNSNTIKTAVQGSKQYGESVQPTLSNMKILAGKYGDMKAETVSKSASLYTLTDLTFPLHLQAEFMGEKVDFELLAPGKWNIDINYKNN